MNPLLALTLASLWVTATRGQSCQDECTACEHLARQAAEFSSLVCILECEGSVSSSGTWRWCHGAALVTRAARSNPAIDADPSARRGDGVSLPGALVKRYGGFMRKGKKLNSAPGKASNDKRFSVVSERGDKLRKMEEAADAAFGDLRQEEEEEDEEVGLDGLGAPAETKRYGGFFRRQRGDDGTAAAGGGGGAGRHEVEKRYGGFMRRLGRPSKKTGGRYESLLRQYMGLQEPVADGASEELAEEDLLQQQEQELHHHQVEEDDDKRFVGFVRS